MNLNDYNKWTDTTAIYPDAGKKTFNETLYLILGLSSEAGEVAGKLKKIVRGDNIDPETNLTLLENLNLKKTFFNIITKSGSTSETLLNMLLIKELMEKNKILDSAEITTKSTPSKEVGDKKQVDVSHLMAKINRSAVIRITYDDVDDDDTTKKATDLNTAKSETTGTSNSILATMDGRGKEVQSAQKTDDSKKTKEKDNNEKVHWYKYS